MKLGIISDTHDFLDPKIPELFKGVDHILHAGDIGMPWLIMQLEAIAPVTAVLGNTDDPGLRFRLTEVVELAGRKFLVHHIVYPQRLEDSLAERVSRERPDVIVFGHTHKPYQAHLGNIFYLNPGYAGKSRFGMERSVVILHCDDKELRVEYLKI
jgi:putative phosphoesterase